jgi:hypothetical protein
VAGAGYGDFINKAIQGRGHDLLPEAIRGIRGPFQRRVANPDSPVRGVALEHNGSVIVRIAYRQERGIAGGVQQVFHAFVSLSNHADRHKPVAALRYLDIQLRVARMVGIAHLGSPYRDNL